MPLDPTSLATWLRHAISPHFIFQNLHMSATLFAQICLSEYIW